MNLNSMTFWEGVVEDINDPLDVNRLRVRIFGLHTESKTEIPVESLPWALYLGDGAVSGVGSSPHRIVQGATVFGYFRDGKDMQHPVVMGAVMGIPSEKPNTQKGFSDPDGVYPIEDKLGESDVNRLARGVTDGTVIEARKNSVVKGVDQADGESWDEPESKYAAKYPENYVEESKSGHIREVDDTAGAERLHESHRSGTGYEVFPDGTKVDRVVMDNYTIVYGDDFAYIIGDCNVTIGGDANVLVKGDATMKVEGDLESTVEGDVKETYQGDYERIVLGDVSESAKSVNSTAVETIIIASPKTVIV